MSNKESLKQFRRNSQYLANKFNSNNNSNSFPGEVSNLGSLKQQHEKEMGLLFEQGGGGGGSSDEEEEGGGWGANHADSVVYSDTDSSEDGCTGSGGEEGGGELSRQQREARAQEKLRVSQRRFATLFSLSGQQQELEPGGDQIAGAGAGAGGPHQRNPRDAILERKNELAAARQNESQSQQRRLQNALMPPSLLEEDFRHRARGRIQHENYFGAEAKSSFVQRVQWVAREQNVLDPLQPQDPLTAAASASFALSAGGTNTNTSAERRHHTIFEDNTRENSHTIDFPFMPRRPAAPDELESVTTEELEHEVSAMDRARAGAGGADDDSVSLLHCSDFDLPGEDSRGYSQQQQQPSRSVAEDSYDTHSVATLDLSASMQFNKQTEATPRTRFIAGCLQEKVHPRASLLLRKNVSTELNLQHQGMGDTMARVLAKSLPDLPFVHSLNLADNNLTDAGLQPLILSLAQVPQLTKLNLSQNVINRDSAIALASYVSKTPILCNLVLSKADIDDFECTMFVAAFADNRAFAELDLSHNEIGTAELLNTVLPDTTTGAEALADFLISSNCYMTSLSLQWNQIRLDGALALAEALEVNCTLTYLDLSYNALGAAAGEVLGRSLLSNHTLQTLNIASNNINSSACFALCMGVLDNYCLRTLILDSNPIGEFGARMAMQMPLEVGPRLHISAKGCNLSQRDPKDDIFSHDHPAGSYELKLEQPFQRAICLRILRLVATNNNYKFKLLGYQKPMKAGAAAAASTSQQPPARKPPQTKGANPPAGKGKKGQKKKGAATKVETNVPPANVKQLKLVLSTSTDKLDHLDEAQTTLLHNLYKVEKAAGNVLLAVQLFNEYDDDGNGSLDVDELQRLMTNIGLELDRGTLTRAMQLFDVDGAGTLEHDEFLQFLRAQRKEARTRILEITHHPIMAAAKTPAVKYIPPKVGTMFIEIEDSFSSRGTDVVMSTDTHATMLDIVEGGTSSRAKILSYSIMHAKIHLLEAMQIFRTMSSELKDPAAIVQKLLPRMSSAKDAKQLMLTSLSDVHSLSRLRKLMGSCLNPMIGQFNGYYQLDLRQQQDRVCMTKLLEQSQKMQDERMNASLLGRGLTGDISQKGDWSCFRNELKDGHAVQLTAVMFNPMPNSGIYRFDFSGADKPPRKTLPMSDERCLNVLVNLKLVTKGKRSSAENCLAEMRRKCIDQNPGVGNFSPVIRTKAQAEEIQFHMLRFYSKNDKRHKQLRKAQDCEELKTTIVERPDNKKLKEQERKRRGKGQADYDSLSSSSEDDEDDYYDDDEAINFVPLYGNPSPDTHQRSGQFSPKRIMGGFAEGIEEGSGDSSGSSSSSSSSGDDDHSMEESSEEEGLTDDVEGGVTPMSLQQLQHEQRHQAQFSSSGRRKSIFRGGSRRTLLDQFETTFDSAKKEAGKGVMRGVRGAKQQTGKGEGGLQEEQQEEEGMLAKRTGKRRVLSTGLGLSAADRLRIHEEHQRKLNAPKELQVHPQAKASKILSALIDVFQRVWLRARHLALMLQCFSEGALIRMPDFGSYRVEVVVVLFCRVVDVQNFDLVWEKLQNQEIACIHCRLGMLSFFNPLKLEGWYCLDVSRYEERVVAKMLAALSTVEPGENWINESFRWEYFSECIPGWELTRSWLNDEHMPHRGYLTLEYFSGGCTNFGVPLLKEGCRPDLLFRKSLLCMVYLTEDAIIDDECNRGDAKGGKLHRRLLRMSKDGQKVKSESAGAGYIKDYMEYYTALLAPSNTPSARIARGELTEKVFSKLKYAPMNVVKDLPKLSEVYFGAGDMVVDKRSDKGKKVMERLKERVLKRARDVKEEKEQKQQEQARAGAGAGAGAAMPLLESQDVKSSTSSMVVAGARGGGGGAGVKGRKKHLDLSVDTASAAPHRPPSSRKKKGTSSTDDMLSEVALSSAAAELTALDQNDKEKVAKRKSKLARKAKERGRKKSSSGSRGGIARMDSMATVQPSERAAVVAKIKQNRGHIDRDK